MSSDAAPSESSTPPIAEAAAPSWSAVKDAGVAADKGTRRRMEVRAVDFKPLSHMSEPILTPVFSEYIGYSRLARQFRWKFQIRIFRRL